MPNEDNLEILASLGQAAQAIVIGRIVLRPTNAVGRFEAYILVTHQESL